MKWIPKTEKYANIELLKELKIISEENYDPFDYSDKIMSRIAVSGDISGSPTYHFRWKYKNLTDFVFWPTNLHHISRILKLANKYTIATTVRGGGTCYFGSSVPTMGGFLIDMKRMNTFQLDNKNRVLITQAGANISSILEFLESHKLSLATYPTSFNSATIGGWYSSNNDFGFGTYLYGPFYNQVLEITMVNPDGNIEIITNKEKIKSLSNNYGSKGVIAELKISLIDKKISQFYIFKIPQTSEISQLFLKFEKFFEKNRVLYFSIGNSIFQDSFHLIFDLEQENHNDIGPLIEKIHQIASMEPMELGKMELGKMELFPKKKDKRLNLQILQVKVGNISILVDNFKKLCEKFNLKDSTFNIIHGSNSETRLSLFISSDNLNWIDFLASKAILHLITIQTYKMKNKCHTLGLQNTTYFLKFEKEEAKQTREKKIAIDPKFIMNPLKGVQSKISFFRIHSMFSLILLLKKIGYKFFLNEKKKIFECIGCGYCRRGCVSFEISKSEEFSACGRLRILKYVSEEKISFHDSDLRTVLFFCSLCGKCAGICPVSFDTLDLFESIRKKFEFE